MKRKIARGILIFLFFFLLIFGGAETERIRDYVYLIVCPTLILISIVAVLAIVANWRERNQKIMDAQTVAELRGS